MKFPGRWLLICGLLLSASRGWAHPTPFSFLDLNIDPAGIDATLTVHIFDLAHDLGVAPMERLLDRDVVGQRMAAIRKLVGKRFAIAADGTRVEPEWTDRFEILEDRQAIRMFLRFPARGPPGTVMASARMFPYDPAHETFVNVYEGGELRMQAILSGADDRTEYFTGTRQGRAAVVARFLPAGIHHILIGPDHILFLIGLLLLGGTVRRLLLMASAFTVAHSLTLSLAVLGVFNPSPALVEPAIALSIVCVGADNLLKREGRDLRVFMALAFGLIHGFGFAGVLAEMRLPAGALGWALFSFNIGVEAGQVVIVTLVASTLAVIASRYASARRRIALAGSVLVLAAGAFWFVERVFFSGGVL